MSWDKGSVRNEIDRLRTLTPDVLGVLPAIWTGVESVVWDRLQTRLGQPVIQAVMKEVVGGRLLQ